MGRGLKGIKTIRELEVKDKIVFLRLDLNVPLKGSTITDKTRIVESLPTIKFLQEKGAKLVLCSHLGRPKSSADRQYSLEPVATALSELLDCEVVLAEEPTSEAISSLALGQKRKQIFLLENIRFEEGETKNSVELAQKLSAFAQVYVNDAFGACHRAHASIHALPELVKEKGIGFLIEKEIQVLEQLLEKPQSPYFAVLGGAKVSDKIPVLEKLIDIVDGVIIGGAMAYTFLKAQGFNVGKSLVEEDKLKYCREMIERIEARNKTLLLPVDHLVSPAVTDTQNIRHTESQSMLSEELGVDIGPKTMEIFGEALRRASTVFWNGPMGIFETKEFSKGTFAIARAVAEGKGLKVVGGGDSAAAAGASGFARHMTHISTGGGASLEYLQGERLPGLEVLRSKRSM